MRGFGSWCLNTMLCQLQRLFNIEWCYYYVWWKRNNSGEIGHGLFQSFISTLKINCRWKPKWASGRHPDAQTEFQTGYKLNKSHTRFMKKEANLADSQITTRRDNPEGHHRLCRNWIYKIKLNQALTLSSPMASRMISELTAVLKAFRMTIDRIRFLCSATLVTHSFL
jgi:hypothetical protein